MSQSTQAPGHYLLLLGPAPRASGPRFDDIEAELAALSALREKAAGAIRITAHDHAVRAFLWPALEELLPAYPDIKVVVVIEYGLTDIVAGRFGASIRAGEMVAKDMVAVRIGPDVRSTVVGAPAFSRTRPKPKTPQQLTSHDSLNLRLPPWAASGARQLGEWLSETRNVFEDHTRYMEKPPRRILRVWLIASSRWQRPEGDMSIRAVRLTSSGGITQLA